MHTLLNITVINYTRDVSILIYFIFTTLSGLPLYITISVVYKEIYNLTNIRASCL